MNEERKMILGMLQEGLISVEEADRLLSAVPATEQNSGDASLSTGASGGALRPKRIRVLVNENGRTVVNVKVPFSLVRAGLSISNTVLKFAGRTDPGSAEAIPDLSQIDLDQILDDLADGEISLPYTMVDVDSEEDGKPIHVEVILE